MIEVNLFSIPASDYDVSVGKCVSRARVDIDGMGVSILEFVKGFIRDNLDNLEGAISNADITEYINSDTAFTTLDFASLNYLLTQLGYKVTVWNVADDEENPRSVGAGTLEYNIINRNYLQHDYPTVTKLIPGDKNVAEVVADIVEESGLFDETKFGHIRNPFNILINNLKDEEGKVGIINSSIITKLYRLLDQMGFSIFCATSEE